MRRREFIRLLGGLASAMPASARAQQTGVPVVGFLRSTAASGSEHLVRAFKTGLSEAGFEEGRNVSIEYRWAEDQRDRLPGMAAELVDRRVAVIVGNSVAARAAKTATEKTPVVFVIGSDPVNFGLVSSLNRPGGNVTGITFTTAELTAKRLELLHELTGRVVVTVALLDPRGPGFDAEVAEVAEARRAGAQILVVEAGTESELSRASAVISEAGAGALLVGAGPFFLNRREGLVALAVQLRLPASFVEREYSETGGLMSYGPSQTDAYRRAGVYVGRILKGEKPADLPVERSTKFELVINLKAARVLGIEVPPLLLARADEVIE